MANTGLQVLIGNCENRAVLGLTVKELGIPIRVVTAHPDYYITDEKIYQDMQYIRDFNQKHKKQITVISSYEFLKILFTSPKAKMVYDHYDKMLSGFTIDSYMRIMKYAGEKIDVVIPEGIAGIGTNAWCCTPSRSMVIPKSFDFINADMIGLKANNFKLINIKGTHRMSDGAFDKTKAAVVFEEIPIKELPSGAKWHAIRAIVKKIPFSNKEQLTHPENEMIEHGYYKAEQMKLF